MSPVPRTLRSRPGVPDAVYCRETAGHPWFARALRILNGSKTLEIMRRSYGVGDVDSATMVDC